MHTLTPTNGGHFRYDLVPMATPPDPYFYDPYLGKNCGTRVIKSDDGGLPAFQEGDCGSFRIAVEKVGGGALVLILSLPHVGKQGRYVLSPQDLEWETNEADEDEWMPEQTVQKYTGATSFTILASEAYVKPPPTSITIGPPSASQLSALEDYSRTATVEPSTTGNPASTPSATGAAASNTLTTSSPASSPASPASPSETSSGTRKSTFTALSFIVGLVTFVM